jgi:hypothetical protein
MGRRITRLACLTGVLALAGWLLGSVSPPDSVTGGPPQRTGVQPVLGWSTTRTQSTAACGFPASDAPVPERSGAAFVAKLERQLHGPDLQLQVVAYLRNARRVV